RTFYEIFRLSGNWVDGLTRTKSLKGLFNMFLVILIIIAIFPVLPLKSVSGREEYSDIAWIKDINTFCFKLFAATFVVWFKLSSSQGIR
ncbi:MAG: hypothetical protein U9R36_05770, partial [Elusimicrobiota bacterium]|nr:hypothetical protein [Elusimicrobiota bacterium]